MYGTSISCFKVVDIDVKRRKQAYSVLCGKRQHASFGALFAYGTGVAGHFDPQHQAHSAYAFQPFCAIKHIKDDRASVADTLQQLVIDAA